MVEVCVKKVPSLYGKVGERTSVENVEINTDVIITSLKRMVDVKASLSTASNRTCIYNALC